MVNVFDEEDGLFLALVNDEGQYSLWPHFMEVPTGWRVAHGPVIRHECVTFIDSVWVDMRPASLVRETRGPR